MDFQSLHQSKSRHLVQLHPIRHLVEILKNDVGPVDLVVYSLAAPRREHPKTGAIHKSTLKPLGEPFVGPTLDIDKDVIKEVTLDPATDQDIADILEYVIRDVANNQDPTPSIVPIVEEGPALPRPKLAWTFSPIQLQHRRRHEKTHYTHAGDSKKNAI